jgi:hypothetical protein
MFLPAFFALLVLSAQPAQAFALTVRLPVESEAGYPFVCHRTSVRSPLPAAVDAGTEAPPVEFEGRIETVTFGYTSASLAEFRADPAVVWLNARGERGAEGQLPAKYLHDGGYKGAYRLVPLRVEVPAGLNLVYRLTVRSAAGSCYSPGTGQDKPKTSETFFVETR